MVQFILRTVMIYLIIGASFNVLLIAWWMFLNHLGKKECPEEWKNNFGDGSLRDALNTQYNWRIDDTGVLFSLLLDVLIWPYQLWWTIRTAKKLFKN